MVNLARTNIAGRGSTTKGFVEASILVFRLVLEHGHSQFHSFTNREPLVLKQNNIQTMLNEN